MKFKSAYKQLMSRRKSRSFPDSSRRKKHRADTDHTDDDRISVLPDPILGHILSLLPTKNAVATTILSKRWKFVWTTTINLDFRFPINHKGGANRPFTITHKVGIPVNQGGADQFVRFVNYVLVLHKPGHLNRFSLTWETGCIPFYVNTWISAALMRNVHELVVCVKIPELSIQVQTFMFTCECLQSLELDCSICISSKTVVSLPRLERLKLTSVFFQSEEAFRILLDGCPVLKHLVIHMNIGEMLDYGYIELVDGVAFKCIISSTFLRRLELRVYGKHPTHQGTCLCGVELDTPSLEYIDLDDQIHSIFIHNKTLASLGQANIHAFASETQDPSYCNSFVEAFRAFDCAKRLTLSKEVIRALSCATIKMRSRFNRLTKLEVTIDWNYWSSLQDFIELSDNLQLFIVKKYQGYYTSGVYRNNSNWKNPSTVPRCLSNSLKIVFICAYDGYPDELAMLDCILKHGSVLEVMHIWFGESVKDFKRKYDLVQKISTFPRKSSICEVKFHENRFED